MNYRDYLFKKKQRTPWYRLSWKWVKIILYLFLIISALWGCGQLFVTDYGVWKVADISGQSVYKPGVFFEIILGAISGKMHYFHMAGDKMHEYSYLAISTWGDAFTKTQSPFYGCFVFPIAWVLTSFITDFGGSANGPGVIGAIFLTSLIVRMITLIFSFKGQRNQDKMQLMQIKQAEIQAKYKGSKDPAAKQKQQLETMQMYKREGISPMSSIFVMFLAFPFLIAMYTVIKSDSMLKLTQVGQISLVEQPWSMITSGHPVYLALLFTYLPVQIVSMILPTILNMRKTKIVTKDQKKARKKQFIMQGVMVIVFFVVTLSIAAGVAVYWIFSAVIQICQSLFFHYLSVRKRTHKKGGPVKPWYRRLFDVFVPNHNTYEYEIRQQQRAVNRVNRNSDVTVKTKSDAVKGKFDNKKTDNSSKHKKR